MFLLLPGLNAKRSKHLDLLVFSPFTPVEHLCFWSLCDTSGLQSSVRWRHCSALWVCPSLAEELPSSLGRAVCCGYHRRSTFLNSWAGKEQGRGCIITMLWGVEFKWLVKCLQHWGSRFSALLCSQSFLSLNYNCFEVKMLLVLANRFLGMRSFWLYS